MLRKDDRGVLERNGGNYPDYGERERGPMCAELCKGTSFREGQRGTKASSRRNTG